MKPLKPQKKEKKYIVRTQFEKRLLAEGCNRRNGERQKGKRKEEIPNYWITSPLMDIKN